MTSGVPSEPRRPARTPVWPVILIGAGAVLLLANFGWLRFDVLFSLNYLLPLLLVAFGLDMLLQGRHRLLVVIGAALAFAALYSGVGARLGIGGPTPAPVEVAQGIEGASRAVVSVSTSVADLSVRGDAGSSLLAQGVVHPLRGELIERSFDVRGGVARFSLGSRGRISPTWGRAGGSRGWDLTLSGRVPIALGVDTGVGGADLDLSQLQLERLDLNTGVGSSRLTLPARGRYAVDIDTGVGSATISVPRGVAGRIQVSRGVGAVSVPARFVPSGDGVYASPDYATATNRVEMTIDTGVGAVQIVDVD